MADKEKICRMCGTKFSGEGAGEGFCSALCRMTGENLGVGAAPKPKRERRRKPDGERQKSSGRPPESRKFPRVMEMFGLPLSERAAISSTFTPEEAAFARKVMKRELMEERRLDELIEWDGAAADRGLDRYAGIGFDSLGESDDGTV